MDVSSIRLRWLWVVLLGVAVLMLGSAWPEVGAEAPPGRLRCEVPVELRGRVVRSGIVCAGEGGVHAALLQGGGVVGCALDALTPGALPTRRLEAGMTVEVGEGESSCVVRLGVMAGERLLALGVRLELNQAAAETLDALPGVGPGLAKRIVDERSTRGPFASVDALRRVRGIGPKTLEKLRPYVRVQREQAPVGGGAGRGEP